MRLCFLTLLFLTNACAWFGKAAPVSMATADLLKQMQANRTRLEQFSAEMSVTTQGPQGRRHGTVSLAVSRPAKLAYQIVGPHGAVLEAFATNGNEMQLYDANTGRFFYGPATEKNLDRLLGNIPLHFSASRWVALFFGEIQIPETARATWNAQTHRVTMDWAENEYRQQVELEPDTLQLVAGTVSIGDRLVSEIKIDDRDDSQIPRLLHIKLYDPNLDLVMRTTNLSTTNPIDETVFVMDPPAGAVMLRLEPRAALN